LDNAGRSLLSVGSCRGARRTACLFRDLQTAVARRAPASLGSGCNGALRRSVRRYARSVFRHLFACRGWRGTSCLCCSRTSAALLPFSCAFSCLPPYLLHFGGVFATVGSNSSALFFRTGSSVHLSRVFFVFLPLWTGLRFDGHAYAHGRTGISRPSRAAALFAFCARRHRSRLFAFINCIKDLYFARHAVRHLSACTSAKLRVVVSAYLRAGNITLCGTEAWRRYRTLCSCSLPSLPLHVASSALPAGAPPVARDVMRGWRTPLPAHCMPTAAVSADGSCGWCELGSAPPVQLACCLLLVGVAVRWWHARFSR